MPWPGTQGTSSTPSTGLLCRGLGHPLGLLLGSFLPQVKAFVTEDIPLYHNLVMKHLPGADPELVLLSFRYEELERIPLSDMSREEINQLVQELGFYRKEAPDAPVPEEFQLAPARPLPTLQTKEQGPGTPSPPAPAAKSKPPRKPDNQEHPDL
ncbi:unnamed protein product [Lepidochelys kempii]